MDPRLLSDGKSSPKQIGSAKSTTKWEPCDCGCSRRTIPLDVRCNRSYREDRQSAYPCGALRRTHMSRGRLLELWDAPTAIVTLYFRQVELLLPQRNGQLTKGGQHINTSRLRMPQGRQHQHWQEVGGGRPWQLVGVEGKKQKFGIRSMFGDPLPTGSYPHTLRGWARQSRHN
jgi:hypothetical protein